MELNGYGIRANELFFAHTVYMVSCLSVINGRQSDMYHFVTSLTIEAMKNDIDLIFYTQQKISRSGVNVTIVCVCYSNKI